MFNSKGGVNDAPSTCFRKLPQARKAGRVAPIQKQNPLLPFKTLITTSWSTFAHVPAAEPSMTYWKTALRGNTVSQQRPLAVDFHRFSDLAEQNGGESCSKPRSPAARRVQPGTPLPQQPGLKVEGIVNGSTNYILTKCSKASNLTTSLPTPAPRLS